MPATGSTLALAIVLLVGLYLVTPAAMALLAPARASRFLLGFAGTARVHYLELVLPGVAGRAFVVQARGCAAGARSRRSGGRSCSPQRGSRWCPGAGTAPSHPMVPHAAPRLGVVAVGSLVLGGLVLSAALRGRGAWRHQRVAAQRGASRFDAKRTQAPNHDCGTAAVTPRVSNASG
jgi:hypothetical protein